MNQKEREDILALQKSLVDVKNETWRLYEHVAKIENLIESILSNDKNEEKKIHNDVVECQRRKPQKQERITKFGDFKNPVQQLNEKALSILRSRR